MNQSKAKAIRHQCYKGKDPRERTYTRQLRKNDTGKRVPTGAIEADESRQFYQAMKKLYRNDSFVGVV